MFSENTNPFSSAYVQSDFFGKGIFWGLLLLSLLSWGVLLHKIWLLFQIRRLSRELQEIFSERDPLSLRCKAGNEPHPLFTIYKSMKQTVLQLFTQRNETTLLKEDFDWIEEKVYSAVEEQNLLVEKNLFILSTVTTLAPFLGLLGTVWGILLTFSQLQGGGSGTHNHAMLAGLSLALTTTVLGLVVAIPALVGYNYLKHAAQTYRQEMETFAGRLVAALQLYTPKAKHAETSSLTQS
ncbi:MAG: MotA/TolQ/ExbB proton channel family protein [Verrucomicrobiota bacterium]|nr:MotA/TolQ/ExbB proton channel family protein [Verrucomicrobiota bacterium]